jgi:hypothetical protein
VERIIEYVEDYKCDGVVFHSAFSCCSWHAGIILQEQILRKVCGDIPTSSWRAILWISALTMRQITTTGLMPSWRLGRRIRGGAHDRPFSQAIQDYTNTTELNLKSPLTYYISVLPIQGPYLRALILPTSQTFPPVKELKVIY